MIPIMIKGNRKSMIRGKERRVVNGNRKSMIGRDIGIKRGSF